MRRLVCVRDLDVLGRPTGGRLPDPNGQGFVLERVTGMVDDLRAAEGKRSSRGWELLNRVGWVRDALGARRDRLHAARFAAGDVAYVARADGELAAWAWVSQAPNVRCPWSGLRFELLPGEAYLYDLWSFPGHRHTGAGAFVMRGLLRDLHERGAATSAVCYVLHENRERQVLHRLVLGFEQLQVARSVRLLNRFAWQLPGSSRPADGPCTRRARASRADVLVLRRGRAA